MFRQIILAAVCVSVAFASIPHAQAISCKVAAQKVAKACKKKQNKLACGVAKRQLKNCNGGNRR